MVIMNDLLYIMIYYEKLRKILQRTEGSFKGQYNLEICFGK